MSWRFLAPSIEYIVYNKFDQVTFYEFDSSQKLDVKSYLWQQFECGQEIIVRVPKFESQTVNSKVKLKNMIKLYELLHKISCHSTKNSLLVIFIVFCLEKCNSIHSYSSATNAMVSIVFCKFIHGNKWWKFNLTFDTNMQFHIVHNAFVTIFSRAYDWQSCYTTTPRI